MKLRYLMASAALLGLSLPGFSQAPAPYSAWSWSGHLEHLTIDKEAAARADVGVRDSATALGFAAERYTNTSDMTLSLGLNVLLLRDANEFYQDTSGGTKTSDASGASLFAEYGPKYRFGAQGDNHFVTRLGYSWLVTASRDIANCRNCYSEDIELDGGLYGVLGVGKRFGGAEWSLQFHQFFTGDFNNSLRIKLAQAF